MSESADRRADAERTGAARADPRDDARLDIGLMHKDIQLALATASELDVPLPSAGVAGAKLGRMSASSPDRRPPARGVGRRQAATMAARPPRSDRTVSRDVHGRACPVRAERPRSSPRRALP